jgi:hypothetical protein
MGYIKLSGVTATSLNNVINLSTNNEKVPFEIQIGNTLITFEKAWLNTADPIEAVNSKKGLKIKINTESKIEYSTIEAVDSNLTLSLVSIYRFNGDGYSEYTFKVYQDSSITEIGIFDEIVQ